MAGANAVNSCYDRMIVVAPAGHDLASHNTLRGAKATIPIVTM